VLPAVTGVPTAYLLVQQAIGTCRGWCLIALTLLVCCCMCCCRQVRLSFSFVYPDKRGQNVMKEVRRGGGGDTRQGGV
jgi:hypothetical protein